MPDLLIKPTPTLPDPGRLVVVSKHDLDWATSAELLEATEGRFQLLGERLHRGAWFLSPRYTVHSPAVSAAFFRAARDVRGRWLKEVRQSISLRREARSVVALARRDALTEIQSAAPGGSSLKLPDLSRPTLTKEQQLDVLLAGHVARQMAFSGIMFIAGDLVPPRTWNQLADQLLGPEPAPKVSLNRRRTDLAAYRSAGAPGPLKPTGNPCEPRSDGD